MSNKEKPIDTKTLWKLIQEHCKKNDLVIMSKSSYQIDLDRIASQEKTIKAYREAHVQPSERLVEGMHEILMMLENDIPDKIRKLLQGG